MSPLSVPKTLEAIALQQWESYASYYEALTQRPLTADNVRAWLADWSDVLRLLEEAVATVYIEKSLHTTDER